MLRYQMSNRKWTLNTESWAAHEKITSSVTNHHSLTLPPSNYCLSTSILSYSLLLPSSHISPPIFGLFLCASPSHCLAFPSKSLFFLSRSSDKTYGAMVQLRMWQIQENLCGSLMLGAVYGRMSCTSPACASSWKREDERDREAVCMGVSDWYVRWCV